MTQAFPLQWPVGRPRTKARVKSAFKVTPRTAYEDLMEELRRYGAGNVVVSSNAPLRRDGAPYADALDDRLDDPGVAVYFVRKKRLVCLSCDSFTLPFENIRAVGLSVKAYRDMERWGAGQIVDQAFEGFAALPPPGAGAEVAARAWWVVLGVEANATSDQIDAAYKSKARAAGGASVDLNAARDAGRLAAGTI
ncbi:J domain-containing protein [Paracoccus suum]|nr:J domain-containing protein [Paracoccus suum]